MKLSDFDIFTVLGKGAFGKVFKVKNKKDKKIYALKEISFDNDEEKKEVKNEAEILSRINHENIVKYFDSFFEGEKFYIVMEFCPDDLDKLIDRHKTENKLIDKKEVLNIIKNICKGLLALQNRKIIHRDLKPENIFLSQDNIVKIGDFGISKQLKTLKAKAKTSIGTITYMAPEQLNGEISKIEYTYKVDNWALGCIIYELCTLHKCFSSFDNLLEARYAPIDAKFHGFFIQELINSLLKKESSKRADIKDILDEIEKYEKENNINQINSDDIKINNVVNCIYSSEKVKEIKLIENYKDSIYNDDTKETYLIAKGLNEELFANDIELYVNNQRINFVSKYKIKKPGALEVQFRFKKLLNSTACMFNFCSNLKSVDLSSFNTSNVAEMTFMFYGCENLKSVNLSGCDFSNINSTRSMFSHCYSLNSVNLASIKNYKDNLVNMEKMFCFCQSLKSIDLSKLNIFNSLKMPFMFSHCYSLYSIKLPSSNSINVLNMEHMFDNCKSLTSLDLSALNTKNTQKMNSLFEDCVKLKSIELSGFKTSNVEDMSQMFENCKSLKSLDLKNFDTRKVKYMISMFSGCNNLISINLPNFITSKVEDMSYMFNECYSLENIDLSKFDTKKVINFAKMFNQCESLTSLDLPDSFMTINAKDMDDMFSGCKLLSKKNIKFNSKDEKILIQIKIDIKNNIN